MKSKFLLNFKLIRIDRGNWKSRLFFSSLLSLRSSFSRITRCCAFLVVFFFIDSLFSSDSFGFFLFNFLISRWIQTIALFCTSTNAMPHTSLSLDLLLRSRKIFDASINAADSCSLWHGRRRCRLPNNAHILIDVTELARVGRKTETHLNDYPFDEFIFGGNGAGGDSTQELLEPILMGNTKHTVKW